MTITRNQPLTTDDIARLAPSALAQEASDGMSQRYTYIPTIDVIDGMREAGFLPFRAIRRNLPPCLLERHGGFRIHAGQHCRPPQRRCHLPKS